MVHLSSATPAVCVVDDGESSAKETVVFWRRRSGDIGKKMRKPETGPSVFARFHILPGRVPSFRGRVPCRVPKDREYSAAVQLRWNLVLTAKGFRRHPHAKRSKHHVDRLLHSDHAIAKAASFVSLSLPKKSKQQHHKIFVTTKLLVVD